MKKIIIMLIVVAILLTSCSSGVSTEEYNKVVSDYKQLQEQFEETYKTLSELRNEYTEKLEEKDNDVDTRDLIFKSTALSIDENALCTILSDELIQITIPMGSNSADQVKKNIEKYIFAIPVALGNVDFKSCLITVVDDTGTVVFGYSMKKDSSTSVFISDAF